MEVDLSAYTISNPQYRKKMKSGLMDCISEYSDEDRFDKYFHEDLGESLKELQRYHQEKASALKALLTRLGYF